MLKYSMSTIWSDEDNGFIATIKEIPGLSAFGETRSDAIKEAEIALEGFLNVYKTEGHRLPEPETAKRYSGQFRVRLSKSLHASLSEEAGKDGVSLNTYINIILSENHCLRRIEKEINDLKNCIQLHVFTNAVHETQATPSANNLLGYPISTETGAWSRT